MKSALLTIFAAIGLMLIFTQVRAQIQNRTWVDSQPIFKNWPQGLDTAAVSEYFVSIRGTSLPASEFRETLRSRFGLTWNCEPCNNGYVLVCEQGGLGTWLVWYVCTNQQVYDEGEVLQFTNRIQNWRFPSYPLSGPRFIVMGADSDAHVVNAVIADLLNRQFYNLEAANITFPLAWRFNIPTFFSLYTTRGIPLAGLPPGRYKLVIYMRDVEFNNRQLSIWFTITGVVPITLSSFTATVQGSRVRLDWRTISEIANWGFHVQRSSAETTGFTNVSPLIPGHGTTNEPHNYTWTDSAPGLGTWYYRLKQIDLDGDVHYTYAIRVDVLTGVTIAPVPSVFRLEQNYPNPFNPATTIPFSLPEQRHVELGVYNLLGLKVATLINERRNAGEYETTWNALGFASGVYFYRLQAGEKSVTKKLTVLR